MNKPLSVIVFTLGFLFLLYAIFGRYLVLPGYLVTLDQGQSTLAEVNQTVSAWKVARYLLWAYAFKLGMWLILLGAAFRIGLPPAQRWLIGLGGLIYIAFAYVPLPAPPSLVFGLAGGMMTVLMVLVIVWWGNGRSHLPPHEQTAADLRMIGYFFFGMATYTLCPLLGVKTFALAPEKMIAYGLQGEAASFAFHLLIELLLGWLFIAFSLRPQAVTAPSRKGVLRTLMGILAVLLLAGCGGPSAAELEAVDYTPRTDNEWPVSTPEAQGLDPALVAEMYYNASQMENIYSLLVFKNGYLVAEDYFNNGSPTQQVNIHSVTKSINSALVGLALEEGCLTSLDQKMMEFFPELDSRIRDPRKRDITIRQMLQMRAGYPWEEATAEGTELLFTGFHTADLVNVPLARDPGSGAAYSNLTAHLLGLIVARACETDLKTFADEHLFGPLGIEEGFWQKDWDGDYLGYSDINLSAYDLAKFGLLYLNDGEYNGTQIVPAEWVHDSLQTYSEDVWTVRVGRNWDDNAYGYQWWSIRAGDYRYNLAWGHGGQQIVLLDDLDMMIVVTVDPLHLQHGDEPWKLEKASLNLVADFVASLP